MWPAFIGLASLLGLWAWERYFGSHRTEFKQADLHRKGCTRTSGTYDPKCWQCDALRRAGLLPQDVREERAPPAGSTGRGVVTNGCGCLSMLAGAALFLAALISLFSGAVGPGLGFLIVAVIVWVIGSAVAEA